MSVFSYSSSFFLPLPTVVPWCSHTWPAFTYDEHTTAILFSPFNSQTTCIQRKLSWSIKSAFVVSVYDCSCHYLTVICIRLLDGTSETCKYLNDSPERNASPARCMYQSERWMSAGCCRHRTAACARMCARQIKSLVPFSLSEAMTVRWRGKHNAPMKCNQTEVGMNVLSVEKNKASV